MKLKLILKYIILLILLILSGFMLDALYLITQLPLSNFPNGAAGRADTFMTILCIFIFGLYCSYRILKSTTNAVEQAYE